MLLSEKTELGRQMQAPSGTGEEALGFYPSGRVVRAGEKRTKSLPDLAGKRLKQRLGNRDGG